MNRIIVFKKLGQLLSLTDPVGNTTSYEYDSQRHVVKETNALDKSRYFEYLGQWLIRKTDRNGQVTEYVYDRFGRQKEERWLEGKKVIKTITNIYSDVGDLIGVDDGLNKFTYEYNAMKLKTKNNAKFNGLNKEITLKSKYDRRGQRTLSESNEFSTQYTYTPTKLTESIIQDDKSVQYSYNATGQRIVAKTPAVTSMYSYDGMGRLTKIDHDNIAHYDYQWDASSRIVSINDGKYDYNKSGQLITANYANLPEEKYNYDLNGNRSNYQTGKNNQLLHDGENAYEYDSEGNRISKGATKYFWDYRNRLAKVETPQETVEYVYDYKNRLVCRSTPKGSEYFVHDGWQIVLTLNQKGKTTNRFLWGANQDELIAQNEYYSLCDHLGTVRNLVGNGIAAHFEYNAFGQLLSKIGNTDCVFKYTGKMTDEITDLQWNINRWYDAKIGRWISEDPIGFVGNDLNLYRISKNSSLILLDPYGLVPCPGGDWTFWGTTSGGQIIIGYTSSIVTFRCNQANIVRKKLYKCCTQTIEKKVIDIAFADGNIYTVLLGAGLGGHVRRTYGSVHNANQASDLAGWSYPSIGFSVDVVVVGGGVSGTCGGGSVDIGAGLGAGISVSAQESYISVTCNWTQRYVRKLSIAEQSTITSDGPCVESFQSVIPNEPTSYDLSLYDAMN